MTSKDCIAKIAAASGGKLSTDQVADFADRIERRYQHLRQREQATDGADVMLRAAREVADEAKAAAIIEQRNARINAARAAERRTFLDRMDDKAMGISMLNVGRNRPVEGGRLSVDARQKAWRSKFLGGLVQALRKEGLLELMTRGGRVVDLVTGDAYRRNPMDLEIAGEMWEIGREGGQPGVTGIPEAKRIAEIINLHQEAARNAQNRVGAWIRKMPGYIVSQSHDQTKIRWAAGKALHVDDPAHFTAWRDFILPRLDAETTFGDLSALDTNEMLEGIFYGLKSGIHHKPTSTGEEWLKGFKGSANVAKKLSQERVLHFSSAEAWHEYHLRFGSGDGLLDSAVNGLMRASDAIGLMEVWGTNPRAAFDAELERQGWEQRKRDTQTRKLRGEALQWEFAEVDGTTRIPGDIRWAKVGSTIRALEGMAKLGGAVISSITDIPTLATELNFQGENLLAAHLDGMANVIRGRRAGDQRDMADVLAAGIDGIIGDLASRFDAGDALPGAITKAQRYFFKLNLLSWWTDSLRTGAGLSIARRLGQLSDRTWDQVGREMDRLLPQYGIGPKEWELMRRHAVRDAPDGRRYMMPDMMGAIPDAEIDGHIGTQLDGIRQRYDQRMERMGQRYANLVNKLETFQTLAEKAEAVELAATLRAWRQLAGEGEDGAGKVWRGGTFGIDAVRNAMVKARDGERAHGRLQGIAQETGQNLETVRKAHPDLAKAADQAEINDALATMRFRLNEFAEEHRKIVTKATRQVERIQQRMKKMGKNADPREGAANLIHEIDRLVEDAAALPDQLAREVELARTGARDEMEMRLRAYLTDRTHTAVIEPGARERAMLNLGTQRGTVTGETLRYIMQFKSFPVAFSTKVLGREIYGRGANKFSQALLNGNGEMLGLAKLIVGTTIFGYLAYAAKDITKGREPRDPRDPKAWLAGFIQGGGAGIYADFIFGDFNRMGGGGIESLMGPTAGTVGDVAQMWDKARGGEDVGASLFQFGKNHTPGLNLFYTRAALDYLILYDIQEAVNPGSLRRIERRLMKENNQRFFFPPSEDRLRPVTGD